MNPPAARRSRRNGGLPPLPPLPGAQPSDAGPSRLTRRALLTGLLGTGVVTAGVRLGADGVLRSAGATPGAGGAAPSASAGRRPPHVVADPEPARRSLVVIELSGGNDGLATLVPAGDPRYRDLRPTLAPADDELVDLDGETAVPLPLAGLQATGVAWLQGVGVASPSLSHFDMEERWWAGDGSGAGRHGTGFLGRVCDALDVGAPITGMSIGGGSPAMVSAHAVTLGLADPASAWFLTSDDPWSVALRRGLRDFAADGVPAAHGGALVRGIAEALSLGDVLVDLEETRADRADRYPDSELGRQLSLAARLLAADVGIRVIHVVMNGFDTHDDQRGTHDALLAELGDALETFLVDLDEQGGLGSTLVATTSEFGRRAAENGTGTDHGAASVSLLCGPVHTGRHGDPPSLTSLDDDGNLRSTVRLEDYYATLATWLDVDPGAVLPASPRPVEGLLLT